ncbi:MAG: hypothetical protein A2942_03700 [Candidatus Lloydbacteria bacterium RIFCSPLOWO2_01_FULL_50_20]|uniref:HTH deoR-type domain-containing protein n=1 Tax=Candidatus Lloydbacteria bacterium RIFCSPLOWO2_01_FULL_50_20 TaxID=1798665 RepID=A0A1G2DE15_9BACT|nr:MAG: hypothetical protein A3C13_00350 [Candidatus Lloydbacteria bacterium RIFCSPHIGHO2_02_FULL_50_11]OGZ11191.1 MAG: hypothetical protein A2942_03700 [Candidatus Lloydbacteria bacterium RIFCSPLOWO2_01_FULL_50_20]
MNHGYGYVMRKAEKLTTALYLVTDIMSEKEPMKWKARESAVDLLSDITIASSLSVSEKMTMLRNVMKKTEKLIAFLDVAQSAHLISEMNSSVLKREYLALKDSIEREWGQVYEKSRSLFSDTFFDVPNDSVRNLPKGDSTPSLSSHVVDTAGERLVKDNGTEEKQKHAGGDQPRSFQPSTEYQQHQSLPTGRREAEISLSLSKSDAPISAIVPAKPEHVGPTLPNNGAHSAAGRPVAQAATENKPPFMRERRDQFGQTVAPSVNVSNGHLGTPHNGQVQGQQHQQNPGIAIPPRAAVYPSTHSMAKNIVTPQIAGTSESFSGKRNDSDRDDRRKIILALIKQKPSLTVKDIAKSIPSVSEKTIQRELLSMVSEGTLQKRGERRWSTYSLRTS